MARTFVPFRTGALAPLEDFYKEVDSLVQNFFEPDEARGQKFTPAINVTETESGYEITLDLPGINPEEVAVELNDGQLLIAGERKSEIEENGKTFHRRERRYGSFRRIVNIPTPVDESRISANFRNGVLTVALPKSDKVKPKRIVVNKSE